MAGLLLAFAASCACAATPLPEVVDEINATAIMDWKAIKVHAGDTVVLRLIQSPEQPAPPPQRIEVRSDGYGNFPVVGDIYLLGLDVGEVEDVVRDAYEKTLTTPLLNVDVLATGARPVYFLGEFRGGGVQTIQGNRLTLIEGIARAGGPNRETELLKQLLLIRWIPTEECYVSWELDARPRYWDNPTPIWLQPYDVVYLPVRPIVQVNTWIDQYIRRLIPIPYLTLPYRFF